MSTTLELRREGGTATLVFGRPPLNILDLGLLAELDAALVSLATDEELQVLVLRGAGDRAFSAGVSVADHTPEKIARMLASFHGAIEKIRALDLFTVACVDGHCLGGGMELALACDYLLASDRSRFGQPEIRLGCFPPVAAALYPGRFGRGTTLELLLSGRTLDAAEAERLGFAQRVVTAEALATALDELLRPILEQSRAVARITKRAVRAAETRTYSTALGEAERIYLAELAHTEDMAEGLAAFSEKRPPRWRHR